MRYLLIVLLLVVFAGCDGLFGKKDIGKNTEIVPELIDSNDIVPYARYYIVKYQELIKQTTINADDAQSIAEKLIKVADKYPTSRYADDALFLSGKLYYETGSYQQAADLFKKVYTQYPEGMISPESNKFGYTYHIAPIAHLYYAMTLDFYSDQLAVAAGEYNRILQSYAKYAEERYVLDNVSGNVSAEAQFNSGYAQERLKNYMFAVQEYMRTVLRYSGYYLSKQEGERHDYADMALERIYIIATGEAKQPDQANIYLKEMLNQMIFTEYFPKIRYYLGCIALDQKHYADALQYFRDNINALRSNSFSDVDLMIATLEKIKYIESLHIQEVQALTENLTEYLAKSILHGKELTNESDEALVTDLLAGETLLFLSKLYYEQHKKDLAAKYITQVFQRYPYIVSSNGTFLTIKAAELIKKNVSQEEYISLLTDLISFIPEKYEPKQILRKELGTHANK